jgi:hypothetical protein
MLFRTSRLGLRVVARSLRPTLVIAFYAGLLLYLLVVFLEYLGLPLIECLPALRDLIDGLCSSCRMSTQSRLQIIQSKPIGNGLDAFRNSFSSICEHIDIPSSA